ncbi:tetratricopeptide repeat protein [Flavobacterium sp.]|uniref:tetratricopeptide repeat protein n=1 Tax=Flavobacterium sp. TaxID=239 RepID=UPI00122945D7|nr:tetratricopeptide repeat protein [Flavobacterium sp.]RZJ73284.1 MAG: tetratricopeptide repeat protein [Flavobacterium sp.]
MSFFGLLFCNVHAQNPLVFNKTNLQSEDKWVVYPTKVEGTYAFGFIFIDPKDGLIFAFEDTFKIDGNGKFERIPSARIPNSGRAIVKIQPDETQLAEIPELKFEELGIDKTPKWLVKFKEGENTAAYHYRRGYLFNEWKQFDKALTYLETADKLDPKYKGLQTELAFSYNALGKHDKAEAALKKAIKLDPNDCYALKELAYTYNSTDKLAKAEEIYKTMKNCEGQKYLMETAQNLAYRYFEKKDKKNFDKWASETRKYDTNPQYLKNVDEMEKQLKK